MCCCIQFDNILLRFSASKFMKNIGLKFSSLEMSLLDFGISVILSSQNMWESVPVFSIFWKSLCNICYCLFLPSNSLKNSTVRSSGADVFFVEEFLIMNSIYFMYLFTVSNCSVGNMWLQTICPFHLSCEIYWHKIIHNFIIYQLP